MPGSLFNVVWLKVNVSKFHTLYKMLNLLIFFAKSLALREPFWLLSKPVAVRKDQHRAGVDELGHEEVVLTRMKETRRASNMLLALARAGKK
ncbi:MAG TPA: hypothetical protein VK603_19445 [Candidatus Saccharimonadales bacterium]|nr:hypothetical protein [Candidatus Saccharimonadales bacterium]